MKLFLQGPVQIGKSTILRNALLPYENMVAGFAVQRLFENGAMCGFRSCALNGTIPPVDGEYSAGLEGIFLYHGQYFPGILEKSVSVALDTCKKEHCKIILLDEIGGLELRSSTFMKPLQKILALGKPCVGVLKSHDNLAGTADRFKLPINILALRDKLQKQLEADGRVFTMTHENRQEAEHTVMRFVEGKLNTFGTTPCN